MKALATSIIGIIFLFAPLLSIADDEYVIFAKSLRAKDYDSSLPSRPIEKWLKSTLPQNIKANWSENITDCGEQTGDPETDRERDIPLCAQIELKSEDISVGYLLLFVGTHKKGKLQKGAGLYYGYINQGNKNVELKKLKELIKIKGHI